MRPKKNSAIPDLPTLDEVKTAALELDYPGEITETAIERVVISFLEGRDLLPDFLGLKKHVRYVFGKRIVRIRDTVRGSVVRFRVHFNRYAEPERNYYVESVDIKLPYQPVRMFKRISSRAIEKNQC